MPDHDAGDGIIQALVKMAAHPRWYIRLPAMLAVGYALLVFFFLGLATIDASREAAGRVISVFGDLVAGAAAKIVGLASFLGANISQAASEQFVLGFAGAVLALGTSVLTVWTAMKARAVAMRVTKDLAAQVAISGELATQVAATARERGVQVLLSPSSGPAPRVTLGVRNDGAPDVFEASGRVFDSRNSGGAPRLGAYAMVWADGGKREALRMGQWANLDVATWKQYQPPSSDLAEMRLTADATTNSESAFDWARWTMRQGERLPAFGIEVSIVSDGRTRPDVSCWQAEPETHRGPLRLRRLREARLDSFHDATPASHAMHVVGSGIVTNPTDLGVIRHANADWHGWLRPDGTIAVDGPFCTRHPTALLDIVNSDRKLDAQDLDAHRPANADYLECPACHAHYQVSEGVLKQTPLERLAGPLQGRGTMIWSSIAEIRQQVRALFSNRVGGMPATND